ncbi:hypothetical protein Bca4012_078242 [Brassica carinata]
MVKKKSKKEKGGSSLKNSDAAAAVSLKNSDAAAASLKNSDAAAAASTSMRFESDEEKARLLFSERLISMIKGDEISLRFKNYISKFYTKEEMQQAENDLIDKSDRMDKNETKYIYQRLTKAVNNTIRLNGYERFAKKCAEEREILKKLTRKDLVRLRLSFGQVNLKLIRRRRSRRRKILPS